MCNKLLLLLILLAGIAVAQSDSVPQNSTHAQTATIPNPNVPAYTQPTDTQLRQVEQLKDIHFDFNRSDILPEERQNLRSDADWLKAHPDVLVTIEGDADERGDIVYNVALSDRRAAAAREALVQMGVPSDRITFATGWGKLYPVCTQSDENCRSQNRRAHFEWWSEQSTSARLTNSPATHRASR